MAELMGGLMMPPQTFWGLTLRELEAIIAGCLGRHGGQLPMRSEDLSSLMHRFPDILANESA